jgi:hypothetical protein
LKKGRKKSKEWSMSIVEMSGRTKEMNEEMNKCH